MADSARKRLDRAINKFSIATGLSVDTISEYIELDLVKISNDRIATPIARLETLERCCAQLDKIGVDLYRAIASKEEALADLSTRADRARVALLEREELLITRQGELANVNARRSTIDEQLRGVELEISKSRFDIIRRQGSAANNPSKLAMRVILAIFTAIGAIIAVFLILGRLH